MTGSNKMDVNFADLIFRSYIQFKIGPMRFNGVLK